jgi:hypothetical protein
VAEVVVGLVVRPPGARSMGLERPAVWRVVVLEVSASPIGA